MLLMVYNAVVVWEMRGCREEEEAAAVRCLEYRNAASQSCRLVSAAYPPMSCFGWRAKPRPRASSR